MALIQKRVSEEQKAKWKAYCQAQQMTESAMLGLILDKVIPDGLLEPPKEKLIKPCKITIRLSGDEALRVDQRSEKEGFLNRTNWTTQLVTSAISQTPVLTSEELSIVRESNRELSAIGRNLNQIARVLNIDFMEGNKINRDLLLGISKRIDAHKEKIARLVNKSVNRWGLNNE